MSGVQTIFFSGKGGTGKSALSGACAAAESHSRRVLHVDLALVPHWTRSFEPQSLSPRLSVCALAPRECLREYIHRKIRIRKIVDMLINNERIASFFESAPGLESIVTVGKIYDLATTGNWDLIVVDAPATGHGLALFRIPAITKNLFRIGPVYEEALKVERWLSSFAVAARLITLPEELPVQESIEYNQQLSKLGVRVDMAVVNRYPSWLKGLDPQKILPKLAALPGDPPILEKILTDEVGAITAHVARLKASLKPVPIQRCEETDSPHLWKNIFELEPLWKGLAAL